MVGKCRVTHSLSRHIVPNSGLPILSVSVYVILDLSLPAMQALSSTEGLYTFRAVAPGNYTLLAALAKASFDKVSL